MLSDDDRPAEVAGYEATKERPMTTPVEAQAAYPALPLPTAAAEPAAPKSPILALVLSLFPGIGQIYNGQPAKAFVFFFAWAFSIYGSAEISAMPFSLLIPFVYFYNLVDAYRSAASLNAQAVGAEPLPEDISFESPAWGGALILLGLLLLLNNLGLLHLAALVRFWPLLLIVAGVVFLYGSVQRRKEGPGRGPGRYPDDRPL